MCPFFGGRGIGTAVVKNGAREDCCEVEVGRRVLGWRSAEAAETEPWEVRRSSSSVEGSVVGCRELRRASLRSVVSSSSTNGGEEAVRGRLCGGEAGGSMGGRMLREGEGREGGGEGGEV